MTWTVHLSREVQDWYDGLRPADRARADERFRQLSAEGSQLNMPYARRLDRGLYELRFRAENVDRRVTYTLDPDRQAITLTTFRKQRQRETREVERARRALRDRSTFDDITRDTNRWRPAR